MIGRIDHKKQDKSLSKIFLKYVTYGVIVLIIQRTHNNENKDVKKKIIKNQNIMLYIYNIFITRITFKMVLPISQHACLILLIFIVHF